MGGLTQEDGVLPISVCLIVKNEAGNLPAALTGVRSRVQEIVVVDTGSDDSSAEIAADFGARVISRPWDDDFSAARNHAIANATGDYCLHLDADERVREESWAAFATYLASATAKDARGAVRIISPTADETVVENIVRVAPRKPGFVFQGRIHEQLCGPREAMAPHNTGLTVDHLGYTEAAIAGRDKLERNARLLQAALQTQPNDAYLLFQLGRTLWKKDRSEAAIEILMKALQAVGNQSYAPAILTALGYALREKKAFDSALELVNTFGARFANNTDLHFLMGLLCIDTGRLIDVQKSFQRCLELGEMAEGDTVLGVGTFRAHHNLGLLYELQGHLELARGHYRQALVTAPDFAPAAQRLAQIDQK